MPAIRHCEYSTLPLPLQVINEIYLDEDRIHYLKHNPVTGELEFEVTVSWSRPEGRVRGYEVRLVEFPPSESSSVGEVFEDRYIEVQLVIAMELPSCVVYLQLDYLLSYKILSVAAE